MTTYTTCYYASCKHTGEIWETFDLKTLYRIVRRTLRWEMHRTTYYDREMVTLYYGNVVEDDGHFVRYESIREVCHLYCSGIDGTIHFSVERD